MTNGQTYTQEQVNVIVGSYESEIMRLLKNKANQLLLIVDLNKQVEQLKKDIELLKPKPEQS